MCARLLWLWQRLLRRPIRSISMASHPSDLCPAFNVSDQCVRWWAKLRVPLSKLGARNLTPLPSVRSKARISTPAKGSLRGNGLWWADVLNRWWAKLRVPLSKLGERNLTPLPSVWSKARKSILAKGSLRWNGGPSTGNAPAIAPASAKRTPMCGQLMPNRSSPCNLHNKLLDTIRVDS